MYSEGQTTFIAQYIMSPVAIAEYYVAYVQQ